MKKRLFFIAVILMILSSCIGVEVTPRPEVKYYYINNSSYPIKITATETSVSANVLDSLIPVGDTIQYWDYIFRERYMGPFGAPAESTSVTITFYNADNTNNRCLEFSEPSLSSDDIRSIDYYFLMEEKVRKFNMCYIITDEHFNDASHCVGE